MVYHLQERLYLRQIYLAQIKLAAFHQRISRRHEEAQYNSFRTLHLKKISSRIYNSSATPNNYTKSIQIGHGDLHLK